jgi:alkylation response protein AidB-like acyl-CoA dehydrogenase
MDFDITEEQNLLKSSARDFLSKECTAEHVRTMLDDDLGYSKDLWQKMAELGWMGITLPPAYGGVEGDFLDLLLLQEEMGRFLMPAPYLSTILAARAIDAVGNQEQKSTILPGIVGGELIIALAVTEANNQTDATGLSAKTTGGEDNIEITGTIPFISYAHASDFLLCAVRTTEGSDDQNGFTLFLVDTHRAGVQITPLKTTTGEKLCQVVFDKVNVSEADMLGNTEEGGPIMENILAEGAIAECGSIIGSARWVLDSAVDYANHRQQFGRPIASFQAIQHKCADMFTGIDGAALITYHAAWSVSDDTVDHIEMASKSKTWCSNVFTEVANEGVQVLGGMGYTQEHDMQLYFRRSRASELTFGDSHFHREKLLQQMAF